MFLFLHPGKTLSDNIREKNYFRVMENWKNFSTNHRSKLNFSQQISITRNGIIHLMINIYK